MREQDFIDFQKSSLIVNKQIKKISSISACKFVDPHSIFGQLGKLEQTLLKFSCLFSIFINLLEFLLVINLIFESSFHYVFPYFFNALNE